jgi:hypothetical protein
MKKSSDFVVAVLASVLAVGALGAASAVEPNGDESVIEDVTDVADGAIEPDLDVDPVDTGEGVGVIDDVIVDDGEVIVVVEDTGEESGGVDEGIVDGEVIDVVEETGGVEYVDGDSEIFIRDVADDEVPELAGDPELYTMSDFGEEASAIEDTTAPFEAFDIADDIGGDVGSAREERARRR